MVLFIITAVTKLEISNR